MPNTGNAIQPTPNVIGYSSTDLFYENPAYCPKDAAGYIKEKKCFPSETDCTIDKNPCTLNEYYGSQLQNNKKALDTGVARYNNTLDMYNRELLRTINYLAGIGMLAAYIYVNQ
jgi:hypothetical protein